MVFFGHLQFPPPPPVRTLDLVFFTYGSPTVSKKDEPSAKAHLNGSKGDPQQGIFWPQKCHFPDFPILTSVGGPWDRKAMATLRIFWGSFLEITSRDKK